MLLVKAVCVFFLAWLLSVIAIRVALDSAKFRDKNDMPVICGMSCAVIAAIAFFFLQKPIIRIPDLSSPVIVMEKDSLFGANKTLLQWRTESNSWCYQDDDNKWVSVNISDLREE